MAKETVNMETSNKSRSKRPTYLHSSKLYSIFLHTPIAAVISFVVHLLQNFYIFVKAHIFWKRRISRVRISITCPTLYN
jgi:ATP-dependent Clp protease adapter protein ClpS